MCVDLSICGDVVSTIISHYGRSTLPSLDIGFNFFTGTLPPELGKMSHLKRFTAPFNFFAGQVPSEFGIMKELMEVNLTANVYVAW